MRFLTLASAAVGCFPAFFADGSHVFPVTAYCLTTFFTCHTSFVRRKLVCNPLLVCGAASHTGNSSLLFTIHSGKSAQSFGTAVWLLGVFRCVIHVVFHLRVFTGDNVLPGFFLSRVAALHCHNIKF